MQAVSCFDEGVGFALRWLGERGCSLMLQSFVEPMIEHIRVPVFLATYCDGRRESPLVNMVTNCPLADVQELREVGNGQRRSEERRVGKECVSTCSSRWWPYH